MSLENKQRGLNTYIFKTFINFPPEMRTSLSSESLILYYLFIYHNDYQFPTRNENFSQFSNQNVTYLW